MGSSESVDGVIANRQIPWCGCSSSFKLMQLLSSPQDKARKRVVL